MGSCDNCFSSIREAAAELQTVKKQAKEYAVANNKTVFVYQTETGHWQFMEEDAARSQNIYPTGGVVSHL